MEMTRERISFTFDQRDTLLFLQMGFHFVRAAVACVILERISGLVVVVVALLFYVHGKHLRSCRDGQLT